VRTRLSTTSSPRHALRRLLLAASLALLACLALPALAQAATVTWNYMGDVSNDWDLGANWAGGQVPGPDDYVVINDPPPGGTARVHCPHSLTLKGIDVGGLFGAVTLTIDGDLTLTQGTSFVRPVGLDRVTGTLTNEAASTLVIQGDYNDNLGTDTVVNYGTIIGRQDPRVSVGPSLGAPLYNHGSVYCDSGRLWLYQGGIGYPSSSFGGGAGIVQMAAGAGGVSGWTLQNGCALLGGAELQTTTAVPDGATVTCQGSNVVNGGLLGPGTLRVEPGSTLTIANNSGFDAGITLDNDGTVIVNTGTGHQWRGGTLLDNSGVLDLQSNAGGLTVDLTAGRARLVNTGTITSEGTGPVIELALDNNGTISVPTGRLTLPAGVLANYNLASKTLTGGTYQVSAPGILRIDNGDIATLAADVRLSGAAAKIEDSSGLDTLRNLAAITPAGAITLEAGKVFSPTGSLTSAGSLTIGAASSLALTNGAFTQTAGTTNLAATDATLVASGTGAAGSLALSGGALTQAAGITNLAAMDATLLASVTGAEVTVSGGVLGGLGTVSPSLSSAAELSPAFAGTGVLSVNGPFTAAADAKLSVDIAGGAPGAGYDRLAVSGTASLDGTLYVRTAPGYTPDVGTSFTVLTCAPRSGTFAHVVALPVGSVQPAYTVVYNATDVTLIYSGSSTLSGTVTWTHASGDAGWSWSNPLNWSPERVPGPSDYVVIVPDDRGHIPDPHLGMAGIPANSTFQGIDSSCGLYSTGNLTLTDTNATSYQRGPSSWQVLGTLTNYSTIVMEGVWDVQLTVNYGTIIGRHTNGAEYISSYPVHNYGNVRAESGTLWIDGGGIGFASSTFGGGAGTVLLEQDGWTLQDGCAFLGGVDLAAVATIPSGATVTCQEGSNSLTLGGGLLGPGTLRVAPGSTLTLADHGSGFDAGVTLDNDGTVVVNVQNPYLWHGGTLFDNSGLLDLQTNGGGLGVDTAAGRAILLNTGTITSEGASTYIGLALDNRGTISVPSGTLALQGGTTVPATGDFFGGGTGRVSFDSRHELADGARLRNFSTTSLSTLVVQPTATVTMDGTSTIYSGRIEGPGTLRLLSGATLATSGYPTFGGSLHFDVEGTLVENSNTADSTWEAGTVLDNSGTIDLQADVGINASRNNGAGTIVNTGTIMKSAGIGTSTISLGLTNNGTISVPTGRLTLPAGVLANYNLASKTLTGGTYQVSAPGILRIDNGDIATLAADVRLSGAAAKIEDSSGLDTLRNLAAITPAGAITLEAGKVFSPTGSLTSAGSLTIGAASSLALTNGAFTQTAGTTNLAATDATLVASGTGAAGSLALSGGALTQAAGITNLAAMDATLLASVTGAEVTVSGGVLGGLGTVSPSLSSAAELSPAFAGTGVLSVNGPFTAAADAKLSVDIAGGAPGAGYDRLAVSGTASLDGTLYVRTAPGYTPDVGTSFTVLTCAPRSGTFAHVVALPVGSVQPAYTVVYNATDVTLIYAGLDVPKPPTVTSPNGGEDWEIGETHVVTWTAGGGSGATIAVSRDAGSTWSDIASGLTNSGSYDWTVSGAASTLALVRVTTSAGADASDAVFTISAVTPKDTTPPTTSATPSGTLGQNSWYVSNVSVTLSASDNTGGSGVNVTYYEVDGGAQQTYAAPFTVSSDGIHTVTFWSTDKAGNTEVNTAAANTITFKIDATAPSGTFLVNNGAATTSTAAVTLGSSVSDANPPLEMRFRDGGGSWTAWEAYAPTRAWTLPAGAGTKTVEAEYRDPAGNKLALSASIVLLAPPQPPVVTSPNGGEDWQIGTSHAVTWTPGNGSGATIAVSRDGGSTWSDVASGLTNNGSYTWTVSGSASTQVLVRVTTSAGADASDAVFTISAVTPKDTTPPNTSVSGADGLWHNRPVPLTFKGVDELGGSGMTGGLAKTEYKLDGGAWTAGTSVTIAAPPRGANDGVHTVSYRSTDAAGNLETAKSCQVKIDTQGPSVQADKACPVKRGDAATFTYKVTDKLSPTATVTIKVRDNKGKLVATWQVGSVATGVKNTYQTQVTLKKGSYELEFDAVDLAGNAQHKADFIKLDVK